MITRIVWEVDADMLKVLFPIRSFDVTFGACVCREVSE